MKYKKKRDEVFNNWSSETGWIALAIAMERLNFKKIITLCYRNGILRKCTQYKATRK